jgi:hypothetical protein
VIALLVTNRRKVLSIEEKVKLMQEVEYGERKPKLLACLNRMDQE